MFEAKITQEMEYEELEMKWKQLHLGICILLILCAAIIETGMFFVMDHYGLVNCTTEQYFKKYVFFPSGINLGILIIAMLMLAYCRETAKKYVISILLSLVCAVLMFVHGNFISLYVLPIIPILTATIYGEYALVTYIAAVSGILECIIFLWGHWNGYAVKLKQQAESKADFIVGMLLVGSAYNDRYGHLSGDMFLEKIGDILRAHENVFTAFRFGGDEFCLYFNETNLEQIKKICGKLKKEIKEIGGELMQVSVSIGIAEAQRGVKPKKILEYADAALYQAKREKDSVCVYQEKRIDK